MSSSKILEVFVTKNPFKNMCNKIIYARPWPFGYQKHLPIQFVERIWFGTSCNAFMSKNCVSIKKFVFTKGFALLGGKDETIISPP